jgi:hypothetical protein
MDKLRKSIKKSFLLHQPDSVSIKNWSIFKTKLHRFLSKTDNILRSRDEQGIEWYRAEQSRPITNSKQPSLPRVMARQYQPGHLPTDGARRQRLVQERRREANLVRGPHPHPPPETQRRERDFNSPREGEGQTLLRWRSRRRRLEVRGGLLSSAALLPPGPSVGITGGSR